MNIIFAGVIAREPLGGPTWVWLQYLLGFRRLGHQVTFLEECGEWPYVYDFDRMGAHDEAPRGVQTIRSFLGPFGLGDRAVFRSDAGCLGMNDAEFQEVCEQADVFITLPTSVWSWRPEYEAIPIRVFLDVDPGFSQLRAQSGDTLICRTLEHCNRFLTYGVGLTDPQSRAPTLGLPWRATRPPVVLEQWPVQDDSRAHRFRTVMQWSSDPSPDVDGTVYGQKDVEFECFLNLPRLTAQPLEVALTGGPEQRLRDYGWHVKSGSEVSRDPESYRRYIQSARAEFSVAKNGYVKTDCGWISDRTICFLASGRPGLVQETGMSRWLPTGEGVLTFRTIEEARAGIQQINERYTEHARAARSIAETFFDSDQVLADFLRDVTS